MAKQKRKKRRGLLAALADGLLSLIDWVCECAAEAFIGALRAVLGAAAWAVRGVLRALLALGRTLLAAPVFALRKLTAGSNTAQRCLRLDGEEFEYYVAQVLRDNGFRQVEVTRLSGDQGVDILARRNGRSYAIQCKNYEGSVGNAAVQEAYAGAQYYGCDEAAVICPGAFTAGAKELARATGVLLWDGGKLSHMMRISGRRPRSGKKP